MKSSSEGAFGHYCVFVLKLMHYVLREELSGHSNHGTTQSSLQSFAHILFKLYLKRSTAAVFQFKEPNAQNLLGSANTDRRLGLLNRPSYLSFPCSTKLFYPTSIYHSGLNLVAPQVERSFYFPSNTLDRGWMDAEGREASCVNVLVL